MAEFFIAWIIGVAFVAAGIMIKNKVFSSDSIDNGGPFGNRSDIHVGGLPESENDEHEHNKFI